MTEKNLYPTDDKLVSRAEKEAILGQRGQVIWFFGLSGSGKSTIAQALERKLHTAGRFTKVLDGDNIRGGLNGNLGFSDGDRAENIRRVAEVAKLFAEAGVIVLASFITPTAESRQQARSILGDDDLKLVYVHASFETCQQRDPKGLYAKVGEGKVNQFTGKDSVFERPDENEPASVIDTENHDLVTCLDQAYRLVRD